MPKTPEDVAILIPSLEPDDRLISYVSDLISKGFACIVIVDDGSDKSYQCIFDTLFTMKGCSVLHHPVNMGKGRALKTGFRYIFETFKNCTGVITVDADGQHAIEDVLRLAESLSTNKQALYLGSRDFSIKQIPKKSKLGNRITTLFFWLLHGQWLPDTQTGLRAFSFSLIEFMENIEGSRFEYEMNVLISCSRSKIPMIPIVIETIYENKNSGSHFHPVRDSMRIYRLIFMDFFKYTSASLITAVLDIILFWLLIDLGNLVISKLSDFLKIGIATGIARILSATTNFLLNKRFVFNVRYAGKSAVWKYVLLCIVSMSLSTVLVTLFHSIIGINEKLAKIVCDTCIFFMNFSIQKNWIFKTKLGNNGLDM